MDRRLRPATESCVAAGQATEFPGLTPVEPQVCCVCAPVADLSLSPGGPRDRQLRYGEAFAVIDRRDGHAFGIADGPYCGWLPEAQLTPDTRPTPHRVVNARQTHAYTAPDFKAPELCALPHLARLAPAATEGRFTETEAGWVPTVHLGQPKASDPVAAAALYLGTPYLWGGDSAFGIDCSGLVAAALAACGLTAPRDSDLQQAHLGTTLPPGTPPQRGDLLFWKGHVAWVADPDTLLHANVHHMATALEPLQNACDRIAAQGDGPVMRHARLALSRPLPSSWPK